MGSVPGGRQRHDAAVHRPGRTDLRPAARRPVPDLALHRGQACARRHRSARATAPRPPRVPWRAWRSRRRRGCWLGDSARRSCRPANAGDLAGPQYVSHGPAHHAWQTPCLRPMLRHGPHRRLAPCSRRVTGSGCWRAPTSTRSCALSGTGPGRQRLRRPPRPHDQPRAALARRRGVGPVRRRRAGRGLPRRRQPGPGAVQPGRRAGVRRAGAGPQPHGLDGRRAARGGRAVLADRLGVVGQAARAALAAAAPRDQRGRRWSSRTRRCGVRRGPTSTRSTRRAWRCTPRRSASRPEAGGGAELYRARVSQLISRGWSFARFDTGPAGVQGRGRLRVPAGRADPGRLRAPRPARPGPGGRRAWPPWSSHVRQHVAPVVSLYVNDWNVPARAGLRAGRFTQSPRSRPSCSEPPAGTGRRRTGTSVRGRATRPPVPSPA